MSNDVSFKKYRYFYNGAIFRIEKTTGKVERFWNGKFCPISPERSFDDLIKDPRDDMSELQANSARDLDLLKRELNKSR